jgi:hypothetical protein
VNGRDASRNGECLKHWQRAAMVARPREEFP